MRSERVNASFHTFACEKARESSYNSAHDGHHLLRAGVDINTIRAWLGHVPLNTTNIYAEVDMEMKAKALATCEIRGTETAWVLDITAGAVRTRLSRARMHVCGTLRLLFCDGFGSSIGTSRNPHLPGRDAHFS